MVTLLDIDKVPPQGESEGDLSVKIKSAYHLLVRTLTGTRGSPTDIADTMISINVKVVFDC